MGTKLRGRHIFGYLLALYLLSLSLIFSLEFLKRSDYLIYNSYFKGYQFENYLLSYLGDLKTYYIDYKGFELKAREEKLSKTELEAISAANKASLEEEMILILEKDGQNIIIEEKSGNKDKANKLIEERDKKLEELKKIYEDKLNTNIQSQIGYKENEYNRLKRTLEEDEELKYFIKDKASNETYTNIENVGDLEEYIKAHAFYNISFPTNLTGINRLQSVNSKFQDFSWSGYIIVPKQTNTTNRLLIQYASYNNEKVNTISTGAITMSLIIVAVFLLKMLQCNKYKSELLEAITGLYKKIPLDIRIILSLGGICVILIAMILSSSGNSFGENLMFACPTIALGLLFLGINLKGARRIIIYKEELSAQIKESLLYKWGNLIRDSFIVKSTLFKIVGIGVLTLTWMYFFIYFLSNWIGKEEKMMFFLFTFVYFITVPTYIFKKIGLFNRIVKGTDEIVSGNLNYVIDAKGKGAVVKLARNINEIKSGIQKSVESQMKSERLKTELITNVSHDLKTPLTSIINYIDLLKNDGLSMEEVSGYVGVLDRKAQRLKTLIEDLFEASKMTSGSVELNLERIDIGALVNQALGEFDEKIRASTLNFRVNVPREKYFAQLDGKKTWRVFENLIGNILKYSQPNTRVYIDLMEMANKVVLTMKNISAYEMEFNSEEIFERFKRGDKSRHTEGSGLGLAIAKSIMELQGGRLYIDIDGDLFKVIIEFSM